MRNPRVTEDTNLIETVKRIMVENCGKADATSINNGCLGKALHLPKPRVDRRSMPLHDNACLSVIQKEFDPVNPRDRGRAFDRLTLSSSKRSSNACDCSNERSASSARPISW